MADASEQVGASETMSSCSAGFGDEASDRERPGTGSDRGQGTLMFPDGEGRAGKRRRGKAQKGPPIKAQKGPQKGPPIICEVQKGPPTKS